MSDEEQEAIKYLEFLSNEKCECEACQHAKKEYKTISNLIKKQQKEIEEKRIIIFAGAEKVKQLEKEIQRLEKDNDTLSELVIVNEDKVIKELDLINKDKIREKIKNISKKAFNNEINYSDYYYKTEILNELLEEN